MRRVLSICCLLTLITAASSFSKTPEEYLYETLTISRLTGKCSALDNLILFAEKFDKKHGENTASAFASAFWQEEAKKSNITVEELGEACDKANKRYLDLRKAVKKEE
jgi:hypothetical protein